MQRHYATFGVGGALKGYYAAFVAMDDDVDLENAVRQYCRTHFPKDWSMEYDENEFAGQPEKYGLALLSTYMLQHDGDFQAIICRSCGKRLCSCEQTAAWLGDGGLHEDAA